MLTRSGVLRRWPVILYIYFPTTLTSLKRSLLVTRHISDISTPTCYFAPFGESGVVGELRARSRNSLCGLTHVPTSPD